MNLPVVNGSIAKLVELGRRRGALATEDLRKALPIDRMSDEDIAATIAYLEEEGVEITLDPDLLAARPRSAPELRDTETPNQRVRGLNRGSNALAFPQRDLPLAHFQSDPPVQGRFATLSVLLAGLIVCGVFSVLMWVLR